MDTAPLKVFAVWARKDLIRGVGARVAAVLAPGSSERVEQVRAVAALESAVAASGGGEVGRGLVAERVAYTWFNRIIALRFMDANGYTGEGVVSPASGLGVGQPEVLAGAKRGAIDESFVGNSVKVAVSALLDGSRVSPDPQGEAYGLLLAEYCRYWNRAMPFMFEREGDFTELLMPSNLLAEGSILDQSVKVLTQDVCKDVEVIGWLYQFYISDRKDEVFAGFKKNKKAGPDEIPAATQLFTPHWIVRYLVENSLGRLWMLNRPTSGLVERMDYYIAPVDEETDFLKVNSPEELKIIDPACGSGHMLTYAFDLLYAIYEEEGYAPADIPELILTNNLFGTEIDQRAGSLAAFALTMKARAKQRTFFNKQIQPNICVIEPISFSTDELEFLLTTDGDRDAERIFWNSFRHSDTLGSLIENDPDVLDRLREYIKTIDSGVGMFGREVLDRAASVITQAEILAERYAVVVANPPYMGNANMGEVLSVYAEQRYPTTRTDLYSMFMERCSRLTVFGGTWGLITPHGWMFQSSFAEWRKRLLSGSRIATLTQFGRGVFGSDWASAAYVVHSCPAEPGARAVYRKLFERALEVRPKELLEQLFLDPNYQKSIVRQDSFLRIEGAPIAFDLGQGLLNLLADASPLNQFASPKQGLITGDNDRFLRYWWEVSGDRIKFNATSGTQVSSSQPWVPYLKGGPPRRWAGNELHVVRWERDGYEIKNFFGPNGRQRSRPQNTGFYFREGLTWSTVAGEFAMRFADPGAIFDAKGSLLVVADQATSLRLLGYLNSTLASRIITTLSPTLDFPQGPVGRIPVPDDVLSPSYADQLIEECLAVSRRDWDASELSMNFTPRLPYTERDLSLKELVGNVLQSATNEIARMAQYESQLDRHYGGLVGEDVGDVAIRPVTLASAELLEIEYTKQAAVLVKDLVSFAVGGMVGRFSLDLPGLILADQGSTLKDYLDKVPAPVFLPDADNVIPIVDGDWFEDDIVARFREFIRMAFGEQHFQENLQFISEALGVRELRDYFVKSFYKDHVQRYKKRPIYWMFSSPKGSFNALIYMHRYTPSTISTVLNEYLREFQAKLRASLENAERTNNAREADRLRKVLMELDEYEHDILYPLASQNIAIDLDDGVKVNYPKFGEALKKIPGLESTE